MDSPERSQNRHYPGDTGRDALRHAASCPERKRRQLEDWYERHIKSIHCLPWDAETGSAWAVLLARLDRSGRKMPVKDSLIAASALRHGLKLAALNARDFAACGLPLVDPSA